MAKRNSLRGADLKDLIQNRKLEIEGLLNAIKTGVANELVRAAKEPTNWGYAGDLGHVIELLKQVSDFLPKCTCLRNQFCDECLADKNPAPEEE